MKVTCLMLVCAARLFGICQISVRDQALLIAKSKMWPFPGHTAVSDIVGSQAGCVSVGRIVVLRFPGQDFLAILDTARVFARWDYTWSSPGLAMDVIFERYAERMRSIQADEQRSLHGNGYAFPDELTSEIRLRIRSGFERVTLLSREQYRRVEMTAVRPDRLKTITERSLPSVVADLITRVEGEPISHLKVSTPVLRWLSIEETVKVSYRRTKSGETVHRFLLIPVNVEMAPFVGEPQGLVDLSK